MEQASPLGEEESGSADRLKLARRRRMGMIGLGIMLAAIVFAAVAAGAEPFEPDSFGPGQDARAYWEAARVEPYVSEVGSQSAYLYSPAFLQLISPITSLPWTAFLLLWTGVLMVAVLAMVGPVLFAPVLLFALYEIWGGNITLLLALSIVVGFRSPVSWAFVLLTKVTPGIGLLWFAVRREWRALAFAAAVSGAVVAISWLLEPVLWQQWISFLLGSLERSTPPGGIQVPLWVRLPIAALLTVYAARTSRQWMVIVAAMLALPVLWFGGLTMLVGVVALRRQEIEAAVMDRLVGLQVARRSRLGRDPLPEA
jgi:hypothetical protein